MQHPGEETSAEDSANPGTPATFSSYWPRGNRSLFFNPEAPRPSTVVITRDPQGTGSREVPDRRRPASRNTPPTDERSGEPQPLQIALLGAAGFPRAAPPGHPLERRPRGPR